AVRPLLHGGYAIKWLEGEWQRGADLTWPEPTQGEIDCRLSRQGSNKIERNPVMDTKVDTGEPFVRAPAACP
ncbi:MAG TPA: hypothetical protein VGA61_00005, partial [Anaerolineae bacterium]